MLLDEGRSQMSKIGRVAQKRAHMPDGTSTILSRRTLQASHKRLAELLRPGMSVLDVGCGNGAISVGIASKVSPAGRVVGMDVNPRLVEEGESAYRDVSGLSFQVGDVYDLQFNSAFDITTASRVLQWLSNPRAALEQMIRATVTGGKVIVLDYNHRKLQWDPEPPFSVGKFYDAFLHWRASAGMDNEVADNLADMYSQCGLSHVLISAQHERVTRGDIHFDQSVSIWKAVMASRGRQMVADGFISETERVSAETEYGEWAKSEVKSQTMYLLAVEGIK